MKTELSSVDVRVLSREIRERLVGLRVDKAYQLGEREVVLKLRGAGSLDFVAASNFMCVTRYKRPAPKTPSSFAMQLRKRLSGAFVMDFVQHGFDRIVEMRFDEYVLVFELFSKGNVILCDKDMKILGLLDWQKWRDRILGVGRVYEYPPSVVNPFEVDEDAFNILMGASERPVAATLATKFSLGGYFAEQVCAGASVNVKVMWADVSRGTLWDSFRALLARVDSPSDARLFEDNVVPFGVGGTPQPTFNEAVDEYFSSRESSAIEAQAESSAKLALRKLEDILRKQEEAVVRSKEGAQAQQAIGDVLYSRMGDVNSVVSYVREARKGGKGDGEIIAELKEWGIVSGLDGFTLTLEL